MPRLARSPGVRVLAQQKLGLGSRWAGQGTEYFWADAGQSVGWDRDRVLLGRCPGRASWVVAWNASAANVGTRPGSRASAATAAL